MRKKVKKSTKRSIVSLLLIVCIVSAVASVFGFYIIKSFQLDCEVRMRQQEAAMQQHTKAVYIASRQIRAGEPIDESMLESREVICAQDSELLFTSEDVGKIALIDISAGTYLIKDLICQTEVVDEYREVCYQSIRLTENIKNYDVVDVRIRYPNGEDYIVLTGKTICLDESSYGKCYLQLNEEEILMMSAAMYDTEIYRGTEIYTSRYIEPILQTRSLVTYLPNAELRKLIQESPNIIKMTATGPEEMRRRLEYRLEEKKEKLYE